MRKHWLDNLRWFTVLLVLLYHVFYFFNNKGVAGGIGGFSDNPMGQPQDIVLYILYPWFMLLLFLLAGMSARYSLENRTGKDFLRSRTRKLLVPATLGLFVFQWIVGYFNTMGAQASGSLTEVPLLVKWLIFSLVGTGPLWFAQDLWLFSLLLLLVRKIDSRNRFSEFCAKANTPTIILLGILIFISSQFIFRHPTNAQGLFNLHNPIAYFTAFLLGYFVFSSDSILLKVKQMCIPVSVAAVVAGTALCITGWGKCYTDPGYLTGWLNCLYAWLMMLAMMGIFMRYFDRSPKEGMPERWTDRLCDYLTRSSFGLYVLHYSIIASLGYLLKTHTTLSPWLIYPLMLLAVFFLTPILYELIRRIPIIRFFVLGEKGRKA